mgnify:CR=1 FL=1
MRNSSGEQVSFDTLDMLPELVESLESSNLLSLFLTFVSFCQAQSQLQVKLSLKTELALISINPAPTHPPTPNSTHPGKFIFQHFSVNDGQVSLQKYVRTQSARQRQFLMQIEDVFNFLGK